MFRRPGFIGIFAALAALCAVMLVLFGYGSLSTALRVDEPTAVEVRRGDSLSRVVRRLQERDLLHNAGLFRLLAIARGDTGRIKAGEYLLEGRVSPNALLDFLVSGSARSVPLTIPEGFSLREIADRLQANRLGSAELFMQFATDRAFIETLKLPTAETPPSLEGFIYPETYFLQPGIGEERLIRMIVSVFRERVGPLLATAESTIGMSPYEALTLASIIEKETGDPSERELISGVFHNRLKTDMRLASDPTVIYGLPAFDGNLTRVHLRTPSPWNTYKKAGLPLTPIANPGLDSIRAALAPANVDYLFFVSKGDGTHHFSKTFKEHNRAVWKYQKLPNRKPS